ncbi:unnamed protein product [Linum trigynum]|uniref:Uncharacterized protein n=1 Tax=Linum trigynum TaxID=586398 RepID=A0AAV2EQP9_9ROSI
MPEEGGKVQVKVENEGENKIDLEGREFSFGRWRERDRKVLVLASSRGGGGRCYDGGNAIRLFLFPSVLVRNVGVMSSPSSS